MALISQCSSGQNPMKSSAAERRERKKEKKLFFFVLERLAGRDLKEIAKKS